MESAQDPAFMEFAIARNQRPRLLHNWGVSLLTIAHKAFLRPLEQLNCPLGFLLISLATAMASMASPIQHFCLSIISFTDDQILAVENVIMSFFPSSELIFDEIDKLALFSETLPQKFDHVLDQLTVILRQLPLLNTLEELKKSNDEEEISVDIHCDEPPSVMPLEEESEAVMEDEPESIRKLNSMEDDMSGNSTNEDDIAKALHLNRGGAIGEKGTIKEVLDDQKSSVKNHDEVLERSQQWTNEDLKKDPILDLFDEVWVKK